MLYDKLGPLGTSNVLGPLPSVQPDKGHGPRLNRIEVVEIKPLPGLPVEGDFNVEYDYWYSYGPPRSNPIEPIPGKEYRHVAGVTIEHTWRRQEGDGFQVRSGEGQFGIPGTPDGGWVYNPETRQNEYLNAFYSPLEFVYESEAYDVDTGLKVRDKLRFEIMNAVNFLLNDERTMICMQETFPGLAACIADEYRRTRVVVTEDNCDGGVAVRSDVRGGKNTLFLCKDIVSKPERLRAVLLHELAHLCGAGELECEIIENLCGGKGANWEPSLDADAIATDQYMRVPGWKTDPPLKPFYFLRKFGMKFREMIYPGRYEGEYIIWDCCTGEVFMKPTGERIVGPNSRYRNLLMNCCPPSRQGPPS